MRRILSWASVESESEFAGGRRGRGNSRLANLSTCWSSSDPLALNDCRSVCFARLA